MHLNNDLNIEQILQVINQLPDEDKKKLIARINKTGKADKPPSAEILKELALTAPVWTDEEYQDYLERKKYIRNSRLS